MRFLFQRCRLESNRNFKPYLCHFRRCMWTGQRHQGYVSYFNFSNMFGFVVRNDMPGREYYFHASDIMAETHSQVRPFQLVEFSTYETNNTNLLARDITAPGGDHIIFNHQNLRLKQHERSKRLSMLPNSLVERYTGIVIKGVDQTNTRGAICPNSVGYDIVHFHISELQTTGIERIDRLSEVEFYVRETKTSKDNALCITRHNQQLITSEHRETGCIRRQLGAMYNQSDVYACIPDSFTDNRIRGYICAYDHKKLFGFITPFESESLSSSSSSFQNVFVHIDDCHIVGKRALRRFEEVEFAKVIDKKTNQFKAVHVTAPDKKLLKFISDNHYIDPSLRNQFLPISSSSSSSSSSDFGKNANVFQGQVVVTPKGKDWFLIQPDLMGYKNLISYKNRMHYIGVRSVKEGDFVLFKVREQLMNPKGKKNNQKLFEAYDITAGGNKPRCLGYGPYRDYLLTKLNCPTLKQHEMPEAPFIAMNETVHGYVAQFNFYTKQGLIEVDNPKTNERFRKVLFSLSDAVIGKRLEAEWDQIALYNGQEVSFQIVENTANNINGTSTEMKEKENTENEEIELRGRYSIKQRAIKVTKKGKPVLDDLLHVLNSHTRL